MSSGGNPTLNNGTVVISGSNSIGSTSMSNYPVQDIPVRIDNAPLVAKDEGGSGIKSVEVHYSSPITYKEKSISLTKDTDGKYRGKLPLTDKDESGEWMVYYAVIYDNAGNYRDVYNSKNPNVLQAWNQDDLSHCNFKLTGTEVDTIKPELTNIEVNKKEVKAGEEVEITVEAKDEGGSGIKNVEVHYLSLIHI